MDTRGHDWTGNPIVDVGLAAMCAMTGVATPPELAMDDLDRVSAELADAYFSGVMGAYLTCVYPNSAYVNPTMGDQKRARYRRDVLSAHRRDPGPQGCQLCGRASVAWANRQHLPMVTGEGVVNFVPNAAGGLRVCGTCLLAAQAFAFGAVRCQGRALAVGSDAHEVTLWFARRAVVWNRKALQVARLGEGKYPAEPNPARYVVGLLSEVGDELDLLGRPASATVYHLTNSGQGPALDLYPLPSHVLRFLALLSLDTYRGAWAAVTARGRHPSYPDRNLAYEAVFRLPVGAPTFVRRYLMRLRHPGAWALTELFALEVMRMEKARVDAVRELGDRLAGEIGEFHDRRLYRRLYRGQRFFELRGELIKLDQRAASAGRPVPVGFDRFVEVFVAADGVERPDWRLARDLVLIRLIERLGAAGVLYRRGRGARR